MTKITALGDSLTKGVVLTDKKRYSLADHSYIDIISKELDLYINNYGKFGSTVRTADQMLTRHTDEIADSEYTLIEFGGNDCDFDWMKIADSPSEDYKPNTTLDEFKKLLKRLISRIKELGSKPVIISLPPILSNAYFSFFSRNMSEDQKQNVINWLGGDLGIISRWHESYNRALFAIASESQIPIVDITTAFDTYRGNLDSLYCADGIHPNDKGHKLIASTIINSYL